MNTIIIQTTETKKADLIFSLLKELKIKSKRFTDEELEDEYLAYLIDKGMEEEGEVPLSEIRKMLRK